MLLLPIPLSMKDIGVSTSNSIRPCARCGAADRSPSGNCRPCCRERSKVWIAANPEKRAAQRLAWEKANPERLITTNAAYAERNAERIKARKAAYYANNAEKFKAINIEWSKKNPGVKRIYDINRRAMKKAQGGQLSKGIKQKLFKLQKGMCPCCHLPLGADYHLDHIKPLALGGSNTDDNVQLLRAKCNLQKNATHPIDFMQSRGFLL